ncbi:MAG: hypothetical protein ACLFR5_05590, partial [Halobacteriales archaeon]
MDTRKTVAVGAVLVLVSVAAVGYAYVEGIGPLKEDPAAGLEEPPETENVYEMGSPENGDAATEEEDDGQEDGGERERVTPPFSFEVESIQECGRTCREVNAVLRNRM